MSVAAEPQLGRAALGGGISLVGPGSPGSGITFSVRLGISEEQYVASSEAVLRLSPRRAWSVSAIRHEPAQRGRGRAHGCHLHGATSWFDGLSLVGVSGRDAHSTSLSTTVSDIIENTTQLAGKNHMTTGGSRNPRGRLDPAPIAATVRGVIKDVLDVDIDETADVHFGALGIDSISSLEMRRGLEEALQVELPATVIYDYPDVASLVEFVGGMLGDEDLVEMPVAYRDSSGGRPVGGRSVGILGLVGSCGSPSGPPAGRDSDLKADMLVGAIAQNYDRNARAPWNRWHVDDPVVELGYWLDEVERFDAELLRTSEQEASLLDPQVRILMEATREALDSVNVDTEFVGSKKVGCYVGCVWTEYPELLKRVLGSSSASALTGSGLNFSSGRISFAFNLKGPCIGIDTACSSSLVAVHLAHASLVRGSIDGGLSAGTNLMLLPSTSQNLSSLGSLSSSGRCKTLDADADGYGRGEGCAVIVTGFVDSGSRAAARGPSPSSTDAISEGLDVETAHYIDNVTDALDVEPLAYLDGCECNQDGRSSSLTAPNGPAQSALISTMLSRAGVPSGHVALMHLHGTGTPLGDPIEVGALLKVFPGPSVHGLVSLKASIGHTEGTAGAHGVAGVIACLSQESLLGFHALRNVNQYVGRLLEESPAAPVMARQPQGLASTGAGRGARTGHQTVSSYGMSGTNACAVLRGVSNRAVSVPRGGGPPALDGRRTVWPCPVAVAISVASIRSSTVQFEYRLGPGTSYLSDHVVGGRSIMPGAGMFFMSTTCVSLAFSRPCLLM